MDSAAHVARREILTHRITLTLWLSFVICFFCNVFAGTISTLMSVYLPVVVQSLSRPAEGDTLNRISAFINALYLAGWAIGGFMWGVISDRVGRVRALALSAGSFGLFTFLISFAFSWEMVVAFRLLSGFSVGGILVITPTLLSEIWPPKTRSVIIGIDSIGFPVGIFSSGLINYLVEDWRQAFMIGVFPGAIALAALWLVRESSEWQEGTATGTGKLSHEKKRSRGNLIKGTVIFGTMLIGLWGMFSWIPTWVQSLLLHEDGQAQRGMAMMLLGAGGLTGGFISGWVSNALGVRKAMLLCFSGCVVLSAILFGIHKSFSPLIYGELATLSLFFGISQGLLSIYIPQLFPVPIRGTYTGICFNTGRIFTAIAVFFVGALVPALGGYGNALLTFASIFIAGFIAVYLTKDPTKNRI